MTEEDKIRRICEEFCAQKGDPPCYKLDDRSGLPFAACSDCLAEAGIVMETPIDPDAAIRDLF